MSVTLDNAAAANVTQVHVKDARTQRVDDALRIVLVVLHVTGLPDDALEPDLEHGLKDRHEHARGRLPELSEAADRLSSNTDALQERICVRKDQGF